MAVVHPDRYINEIARRMHEPADRAEIDEVLDRLDYIYEVDPPMIQDSVETLFRMLQDKPKAAR